MQDSELTKVSVGDIVMFVGYSGFNEADEDQTPKIPDGTKCRVTEINLETKGVMVEVVSDTSISDTAFPDEIDMLPVETDAVDPQAADQPEDVATETTDAKTTKAAKAAKAKAAKAAKAKASKATKAAPKVVEETSPDKSNGEDTSPQVLAEEDTGDQTTDITAEVPTEDPTEEVETNTDAALSVPLPADGFADSDSVTDEIQRSSGDAINAARMVSRRSQDADFILGGVLHNIHRNKLHEAMGYDRKNGFREFCENEIGVGYRKAAYLIKIYEWARGLNIDEHELGDIGWTKARQLAAANVTQDQFVEMAQFARTHSKEELEDHIKTTMVNTGPTDTVQKKVFKFTLYADEANIVERALITAQGLCGDDDISKAFAYMAADWAMINEGVTMTEAQILHQASVKLGGKRVVTVAETDGENTG